MAIEVEGGGGGFSIGDIKPMDRRLGPVATVDGQTWIRAGHFIIDDTNQYPDIYGETVSAHQYVDLGTSRGYYIYRPNTTTNEGFRIEADGNYISSHNCYVQNQRYFGITDAYGRRRASLDISSYGLGSLEDITSFEDNIFVISNTGIVSRIELLSSGLVATSLFTNSHLSTNNGISSIAADANHIYVLPKNTSTGYKYDYTGVLVQTFTISNPTEGVVYSNGYLYAPRYRVIYKKPITDLDSGAYIGLTPAGYNGYITMDSIGDILYMCNSATSSDTNGTLTTFTNDKSGKLIGFTNFIYYEQTSSSNINIAVRTTENYMRIK